MIPLKLLCFAVVNSFLATFPVGYHVSVLNIPNAQFEQFVNQSFAAHYGTQLTSFQLTNLWSFIVALFNIGAVVGSVCVSVVAQRFGRNMTLFVMCNLMNVLGGFLMGRTITLASFEVLALGRLIAGCSAGLSSGVLAIYLTEVSPDRYRGMVGNMENFFITVNSLIGIVFSLPQVLGTKQNLEYLIGFGIVPAVIQMFLTPFFPESPKFLFKTGSRGKLEESIRFYHGPTADVGHFIREMEVEHSMSVHDISFVQVFRSKNLRFPVIIGALVIMSGMFTGIVAIFNYSQTIFESAGISPKFSQYGTIIMSLFNVSGSVIGFVIVDRFPRRRVLLVGLLATLLCNVAFVTFRQLDNAFHAPWLAYACLAAVLAHVTLFNMGAGVVGWFVGPEMTPQSARSITSTVGATANWCTNLILVQFFLVLNRSIGSWSFLVLFIAPTIPIWLVLYSRMPETKNRTMKQIVVQWWDYTVDGDADQLIEPLDPSEIEAILQRSYEDPIDPSGPPVTAWGVARVGRTVDGPADQKDFTDNESQASYGSTDNLLVVQA